MVILVAFLGAGCVGKGSGGCVPGERLCACRPDATCGAGLACTDGFCVPGGVCTAGAEGCPCGPGASCDARDGIRMECLDDVCAVPECPKGVLGCPCDAGACTRGLACVADRCAGPPGASILVGNAAVRACDLLLDRDGATVTFSAKTIGEIAREGSRVAASFTSRADEALADPVAAVVPRSDKAADLSGLSFVKSECFDRLGQTVADPGLRFQ